MIVRTVAPAKINWTLEVLGKRPDGYHEIKSVMQTIDLCDEVTVKKSERTTLTAEGYEPDEDDLTLRAVRSLEDATRRDLPVSIRLVKRIPMAAGLGGGSSDAAAVLRAVDRLYGLGISREELAAVGVQVGSDVPFFVYGGTALVEGRGERVTPLPDVAETWVVVVVPPIGLPEDKTKRMYGAIMPDDYTNGSRTAVALKRIRGGDPLGDILWNVFDHALDDMFPLLMMKRFVRPGIADYRRAMEEAGAGSAHVSGSGPSLFGTFHFQKRAAEAKQKLSLEGVDVFTTRTLGAEEATRGEVSGVE